MHNGRLTIQDLKDTRYIDLPSTTASFSPHMTDAQWQQRFLLMKSMVEPSTEKKFYKGKGREGSYDPDQPPDRYDGATEWQYYVAWINDILRQIRKGHTEYTYFCYQVRDLLRFEHDRLRTRYFPKDRTEAVWIE